MITQLTTYKTEIHGEHREITEEASWTHRAELRAKQTEGNRGARAVTVPLRVFRSERARSERQDSGGETCGAKGKGSR